MRARRAIAAGALMLVLGFSVAAEAGVASCTFDEQSRTVTLAGTSDEIILYAKLFVDNGAIVYQEFDFLGSYEPQQPCGSATTSNTDLIRAVSPVGVVLYVEQTGGPLAPGATPEATGTSEIEMEFPDQSQVHFSGTNAPDVVRFGRVGANINADDDADLTFSTSDSDFQFLGQGGNDDLAATGGLGTGGVAKTYFAASGGEGEDRLSGGHSLDGLQGGKGDDVIIGGNGPDQMNGGPGDDRIIGGRGFDSLLGGPGNDLLRGGSKNDFLRGDAGRDRCIGGASFDEKESCE